MSDHAIIADDNRIVSKAIPPQILEDWATQVIEYSAEENIMSSMSVATMFSKIFTQVLKKGTLASVITTVTGVQLIVHAPLLNIQFPGNAFIF